MKTFSRYLFLSALVLFFGTSALAQSQRFIPIGDIEGISSRWETLEREGIIENNRGKVSLQQGAQFDLWFMGDLARRGPFGIETMERAIQLIDADKGSLGIIGNHDVNSLSFLTLVPSLDMGLIESYNEWLTQNGLENNRYNQLDWWSSQFGLKDKVHNFWLELALNKISGDPSNTEDVNRFKTDGKIAIEKLARVISHIEVANSFLRFAAPGGLNFTYLERSSLVEVVDSKEGKRYLLMHSGQPTSGNLGVVPGAADKFYSLHPGSDWIVHWAEALNNWKDGQLAKIQSHWSRYIELRRSGNIDGARSVAKEILNTRLPKYGDAGWDPKLNKVEHDANSVVYPNSAQGDANSLPSLPDAKAIDLLARAKVDFVLGGHSPVGDAAVTRVGRSSVHQKSIHFIMTDTSYSPVEGKDIFILGSDGSMESRATTRDGKYVVIDLANNSEIETNLKSSDETRAFRATQMSKIGRTANGYLVVGFEGVVNASGKMVPDYERMVLLKQDGFKFEYKTVDRWGLDSLKLGYLETDLNRLYEKAHEERIEMLRSHGKENLSQEDFQRFIQDKRVIISSGPASNSLEPVMDAKDGQPENLRNYLESWRAELRAIPLGESAVLLGGGTHGLEQMKNEIASEVNQERVRQGGKPFSIIGVITGITGGSELDSKVHKFVVSNAFYWEDYFKELLKMVKKGPSQLSIRFGGGGGIVTQQIDEAIEFKRSGVDVEIVLEEGLSKKNALSATDKAIESARSGKIPTADVEIRTQEDMNQQRKLVSAMERFGQNTLDCSALLSARTRKTIDPKETSKRAGRK